MPVMQRSCEIRREDDGLPIIPCASGRREREVRPTADRFGRCHELLKYAGDVLLHLPCGHWCMEPTEVNTGFTP
jgi:hypothetical protein